MNDIGCGITLTKVQEIKVLPYYYLSIYTILYLHDFPFNFFKKGDDFT